MLEEALCTEGYWWVAVPTGTSWEAKQLGQMLSVPIVLCRAEPDAPKSEEIWTQRFSADGRVRNNHPVQGKGETREGFGGKNRRRVSRWLTQREGG